MKTRSAVALSALAWLLALAGCAANPLPSWNDGPARSAIVEFVETTTDASSPNYVPPEARLATFDQDGTLWVEHPLYTEVVFSLERVVEMAPAHPEWRNTQPFKSVIDGDRAAIEKFSTDDLLKIVAATHTGMTAAEFERSARDWIAKARHRRWDRPYTELAYAPMQELLGYLRANGYRTYIVTGGTQPFVRAFAEATYGIPPEQVIGTAPTTTFTQDGDSGAIMLDPKLLLNNNYSGKAEDIYLFTGRQPKAAFGNTAGDAEMLASAQASGGANLAMLLLHDDAAREYAYGPARGLPDTKVGAFSQALDDKAKSRGWFVISMKNDWKRVFAFER